MARLAQAEFFEGVGSANHPDFEARDRVNRAPRMFGFLRLERGRPLRFLPAGRRLIEDRDAPNFDLFLHQLLKWQYPSAMHAEPDYRELFDIRPFLECLRLIRELGYLTKVELALYGVPFVNYRDYDRVRRAILDFRQGLEACRNRKERGTFLADSFHREFGRVYRDDVRAGRIGTREEGGAALSVDDFIAKKVRNARDYADAALRYFRATGLFYIRASPFHYRLRLLEERLPEVDRILETVPRSPHPYQPDTEAFYRYLGDPDQPRLPDEEPDVLKERIRALGTAVSAQTRVTIGDDVGRALALNDSSALKAAYHLINQRVEVLAIEQLQAEFALNHAKIPEIDATFDDIKGGNVPDRPMYFEWNVWRALCYLDCGEVKPNFTMDRTGQPILISSGMADMECHYESFHLMVDVTMSYGATQANMEGEPVPRHVGLFQQQCLERGDLRPVYGLFVAPKLVDTVVAMFYAWHRINTRVYGSGGTRSRGGG